jgi:dethiobiotin synthetase
VSSRTIVITGTDTDVGKTVFSAALAGALGASYWKPIQAGLAGDTDMARVSALSGLPAVKMLPEAFCFRAACSPHRAAELDGVRINVHRLDPPDVEGRLVIEGAGGVLVPVTRDILLADLFARWGIPTVLVARTTLGTINHSLLSIEALRARKVPLIGIVFIGEANEDSEAIIAERGEVRRLGRLPLLNPLDRSSLTEAFAASFDLGDFE